MNKIYLVLSTLNYLSKDVKSEFLYNMYKENLPSIDELSQEISIEQCVLFISYIPNKEKQRQYLEEFINKFTEKKIYISNNYNLFNILNCISNIQDFEHIVKPQDINALLNLYKNNTNKRTDYEFYKNLIHLLYNKFDHCKLTNDNFYSDVLDAVIDNNIFGSWQENECIEFLKNNSDFIINNLKNPNIDLTKKINFLYKVVNIRNIENLINLKHFNNVITKQEIDEFINNSQNIEKNKILLLCIINKLNLVEDIEQYNIVKIFSKDKYIANQIKNAIVENKDILSKIDVDKLIDKIDFAGIKMPNTVNNLTKSIITLELLNKEEKKKQ